ncbi:hypothetical protein KGO95_03655 [Patescibacteria group bacterium]|nr:hypothetical protein [Patescibacteria group bacterium]
MDTVTVLARVIGGVYAAVGLSTFNKPLMNELIERLDKDRTLMWFGGFIALVIGAVTLALYSAWTWDWRVLVTILGWAALVKGLALLLLPETMMAWYRKVKGGNLVQIAGSVIVIIGLYLFLK